MRLACRRGVSRGVKESRNGSQVTHLLFTNYYILFGEASLKGVQVFKNVLKEYELTLGQCINFEKSMVFFSTNTREDVCLLVARGLRVQISSIVEKYLGLPNIIGRQRRVAF